MFKRILSVILAAVLVISSQGMILAAEHAENTLAAGENMEGETDVKGSQVYNVEWDKYSTKYYYNQLNEKQKEVWEKLDEWGRFYIQESGGLGDSDATYMAGLNGYSLISVRTEGLTAEERIQVIESFICSNPQYYFLNGKYYIDDNFMFEVAYLYLGTNREFKTAEDRANATKTFKNAVNEWETLIGTPATADEALKKIYDLAALNVAEGSNTTSYDALCNKSANSAGTARIFQMFSNKLGYDAIMVPDGDHAWNKVKVDGAWYNVDVSLAYKNGSSISYDYYMRSDANFADNGVSDYTPNIALRGIAPSSSLDTNSQGGHAGTFPTVSQITAEPVVSLEKSLGKCKVTITSATPNAKIYYTLDGTTPAEAFAKANRYKGSFEVSGNNATTLKAIAVCDTYKDSAVVTTEIKPLENYKITYVLNGGTNTSKNPSSYTEGSSVTLVNPSGKKGYVFDGWYSDAAFTTKVTGITEDTRGDQTFYVKWVPINYKITYNLNGGKNNSANPSSYTIESGTITLNEPKRTGYLFNGWFPTPEFKLLTRMREIAAGSTGDITLYAKWSVSQYRIKFDGNGSNTGGTSSMNKCEYGKSYKLTANGYIKYGYKFTGWNTKADGSGKSYKDKASVKNLGKNDETITLYAQWKKVKYTITYKLNGGTNNKKNPKSYYVTTKTTKLKNPTRKGYTFKGWYTSSDYKTRLSNIKKGSWGNKTLYAKWLANEYNIKFSGNGATSGKMTTLKNYEYGKKYKLPANQFKRTGYTFAGWNTKKNGSGKTYKNMAQIKNLTTTDGKTVTLYAQWKKKK